MLNIGDSVIVRPDLLPNTFIGGLWVVADMVKFCGKKVVIDNLKVLGLGNTQRIVYLIKDDKLRWYWSEKMFCNKKLDPHFVDLRAFVL